MKLSVISVLCLCFFIGSLTAASAASIGFVYPEAMPDNGFPVDEVISIPVFIEGAQNLGFLKASISDISGGIVVIGQSDIGNTKTSDDEDVIIWYGNYTGGLNGKFNSSGYNNAGTATLFYINLIPDGSEETVDVTLTFNEIWTTNLVNATPTYMDGNSVRISLPVDGGETDKVIVSYSEGEYTAEYVPDTEEVVAGSTYVVSSYRASAEGNYVFNNWMMGNGIYAPGDKVTINEDSEFIARWIPIEFTPVLEDVVLVNNYIIGDVEDIDPKYDVNDDGEIDIFDLVYIAQFVADH